MTATATARRLAEFTPAHRVISLYLDLDPAQFATPDGRTSEVTSLLDGAGRHVDEDESLNHEQRISLREDLGRLREYLEDPPTKGVRALAIFSCAADGLFETVTLTRPVPMRVVIGSRPYIEPLIGAGLQRRWLVALVSKRTARFLTGDGELLDEHQKLKDRVHGQHSQGGWSQANYQRSVEDEAEHHFQRVAELLGERWRTEHFDRLALGGTSEDVARLEPKLDGQTRTGLLDMRVSVEVEHATLEQVGDAMRELVEEDARRREHDALEQLRAGVGTDGHATGGPEQTIVALNEHRVSTLLLAPDFNRDGGRCPSCGLLAVEPDGHCPVDDTPLERVELREATVEAAVIQDADMLFVTRYPDLGPFQGIGALTRF
ncbi:MAG TPA: Vms1/Ankzf1 family peptidyl-tRNA hydrolase [Solirubrobacteraceae bacterium]|nr:Vms1/Ankzf1 family peptidyl-tRNA hydrolase [Solirubrobacteraceae bacterium]